jgi:membrane associated rhomboid family serine protease
MLPIRDHNPATRRPYVNHALIVLNIAVFAATLPLYSDERALMALFDGYAIIPENITAGANLAGLFTSMFLHGGLMHLAGNMLFLWIFGDNVEDQLGHGRYALFYLASGLGAGVIQVLADPSSAIPVVGASGAIAGVMGGYLLMFPRARIDILIFLIVIVRILPVPAWMMLGLWFAMQIAGGAAADAATGGVAYWAHAGGFVAGIALMLPHWWRRGGPDFWRRTRGMPAHPAARYRFIRSDVPSVPRTRKAPGAVPTIRRRR